MLTYDEPHVLSVTHYSPMMGQPDEPENYHTLVYTLTADGDGTHLELTQDGSEYEEQAEQFSPNWQSMLDGAQGARRGADRQRLSASLRLVRRLGALALVALGPLQQRRDVEDVRRRCRRAGRRARRTARASWRS